MHTSLVHTGYNILSNWGMCIVVCQYSIVIEPVLLI